jgi:hypothetical protein
MSEAAQVPGELAHQREAALLRRRALMGMLGEPLPGEGSGQLALQESLGAQITIKRPEDSAALAESAPARVFRLNELVHDRGQRPRDLATVRSGRVDGRGRHARARLRRSC